MNADETHRPVYLDYNATTPHDPEVVAAMRPYLEHHFGNPSSSHAYGRQTRQAVDTARSQVAAFLRCRPEEIIFTSGGTEANNHAIKGVAFAHRHRGNHIITSQIEHPAVIEVTRFLQKNGFEVTYVPVDGQGLVDVVDVKRAVTSQTILISIMHANNEVGTIQPVEQIAQLARENDIFMHTDAAQSAGKISVEVDRLGIDLLSVAGHKLYAPKGIGALYLRTGVELETFMHGAGHEQGRRAGTENVLEIVGLGQACEIANRDLAKNSQHMQEMRDRLHNGLCSQVQNMRLNGHAELRLPNTLSASFFNMDASDLLAEIEEHVAVSAGAACHSGQVKVSAVLQAMAVPIEWARGTLRFSTGRFTTAEEIDKTIDVVAGAVMKLRQ
jgi:cysteine desulfurase